VHPWSLWVISYTKRVQPAGGSCNFCKEGWWVIPKVVAEGQFPNLCVEDMFCCKGICMQARSTLIRTKIQPDRTIQEISRQLTPAKAWSRNFGVSAAFAELEPQVTRLQQLADRSWPAWPGGNGRLAEQQKKSSGGSDHCVRLNRVGLMVRAFGCLASISTLYCSPCPQARVGVRKARGVSGLAVLGFNEEPVLPSSAMIGRQCALLPSYEMAVKNGGTGNAWASRVHRLHALGAQVLTRGACLRIWRRVVCQPEQRSRKRVAP